MIASPLPPTYDTVVLFLFWWMPINKLHFIINLKPLYLWLPIPPKQQQLVYAVPTWCDSIRLLCVLVGWCKWESTAAGKREVQEWSGGEMEHDAHLLIFISSADILMRNLNTRLHRNFTPSVVVVDSGMWIGVDSEWGKYWWKMFCRARQLGRMEGVLLLRVKLWF